MGSESIHFTNESLMFMFFVIIESEFVDIIELLLGV